MGHPLASGLGTPLFSLCTLPRGSHLPPPAPRGPGLPHLCSGPDPFRRRQTRASNHLAIDSSWISCRALECHVPQSELVVLPANFFLFLLMAALGGLHHRVRKVASFFPPQPRARQPGGPASPFPWGNPLTVAAALVRMSSFLA